MLKFVALININSEFATLAHRTDFPSPLLMLAAGEMEQYILQTKNAPILHPGTAQVTEAFPKEESEPSPTSQWYRRGQ